MLSIVFIAHDELVKVVVNKNKARCILDFGIKFLGLW
jgi:hypothetical protein